jgi:hypothetical protein
LANLKRKGWYRDSGHPSFSNMSVALETRVMKPIEFNEMADPLISVLKKSIDYLKSAKSIVASESATADFHFNAALRELTTVLDA